MAISSFFSNPSNLAEAIALAVGLATLSYKKVAYWRLFLLYLFITICIELVGFYFRSVLKKPNYPVYNFFMILQSLFFAFIFCQFSQTRKVKFRIILMCAAFFGFFIVEGIVNSFEEYNQYSRQMLSVFVVLLCCMFYFSLLKNDSIKSLLSHAPFWIVTGLFFFYFGSVAIFAIYDRVSKIKESGSLYFYTLVIGSLSCLLYGCWIIGFVCINNQIRSSRRL